MTRDELAKKRGVKIESNRKSAAEALLTSNTTTITENKEDDKTEPKAESKKRSEKPKTKSSTPKKTNGKKTNPEEEKVHPKAGRPKGKPSTKISLNVPNDYLEIVNIASGINFKGNTSSYIISLIEKDIKANGKVYQQIKKLKQS